MKEVKVDFDEIKLVPTGIESVEIDEVKLNFINDTEKKVTKTKSKLVINNSIATSLLPGDERVSIHIIAEYCDLEKGAKVRVHERTSGTIGKIENVMTNSGVPSTYEMTIYDIDLIEYTMEVKTREDELEDMIKSLMKEFENQRKCFKKDMDELLSKQKKQEGEFIEFKDRIHKAFGVGQSVTGGNVSSDWSISPRNY